jgi:glutamate-1-semialdehyde aminotransferase
MMSACADLDNHRSRPLYVAKTTATITHIKQCLVSLVLHNGMLAEGVYLVPSDFEAGFLSAAHTQADIQATVAAAWAEIVTDLFSTATLAQN